MQGEAGFSLVEVLVAGVILGLLASLAIPVFAVYKAQTFNARANVDLRNAIAAEEANFDTHTNYVSCGPSDCASLLPGYTASDGVLLNIEISDSYFSVAACHNQGNKIFLWDSESGNYQTLDFSGNCNPTPPPIN